MRPAKHREGNPARYTASKGAAEWCAGIRDTDGRSNVTARELITHQLVCGSTKGTFSERIPGHCKTGKVNRTPSVVITRQSPVAWRLSTSLYDDHQCITCPPSTFTVWPVTWRALGEDRKTTMSAISSGCCQRPRGATALTFSVPQSS